MSARLIRPSVEYEETYREFVSDFGDEPLIPFSLSFPYEDFPALIERLDNQRNGVGLREGWVPDSTLWLVDDEEQIVAVSNLRHQLTDSLRKHGGHIGYGVRPAYRRRGYGTKVLELTLLEAKKLGITRALITCSKSNPPSAKVILNNGGVFSDEEWMEEVGEVVQRYWIDL